MVTIAPIVKGVGDTLTITIKKQEPEKIESEKEEEIIYSKLYTYFPIDEEYAFKTGINLSFSQVYHIDNCVREYNKIIKKLVDARNLITPGRYHIIDYSAMLDSLAFKRKRWNSELCFSGIFRFSISSS